MSKYNNRSIAVAEKQLRKQENAKTGFTLVELLVVIAIIALLMSILMPALRRVKMQAEEVKCKANTRQIGLVIYMYLQDEDFRMPDCHVINRSSRSNKHLWHLDNDVTLRRMEPDEADSYWGTAYNDYVKDIDIFGCPSMTQFAELLANDLLPGYPGGIEAIKKAAFGLNGYLDQLNTNNVRMQAEIVICTDHVEPRNEQANDTRSGDMFCWGDDVENLSHYRENSDHAVRPDHYRGIFRHSIRYGNDFRTGGKAAVLWLDGHASMLEETTGDDIPNRYYDPRGRDSDGAPGWLDI